MDDSAAQESHMDFYAQFDCLQTLEKEFLKIKPWFFLALPCPASQISPIWRSG